ncbi:MAG: DegQ family serine endoprotease [Proteobacteria bacterium]|nr:DegQ family serine endoprotease [Pseudomonadota bacterium]
MNNKIAVSVAAALTLGLGIGAYSGLPGISSTQAAPAATSTQALAAAPVNARGLPDFTALVEREGPAVVNISVTSLKRQTAANPDDPSFELFRRFGLPMPQERAQPKQGQGSGFIVSADGTILTNAHVVADATEVTVRLTDKREFKARVLGVDRRTDVALVKIDATGLPVVHIGDSAKARTGEWVAAIGSPFGLENTVTAGIISAKSRSLPDENYVPFIQTDVAINPGNSGGPLFNMNGEVIGINSQIYSQTGGYMGLSFAIPIDVAMKVKDQLQQYGKVSRGRLGIGVQGVTKELAESFGLAKPEGALVTSVERDSPAEKAGMAAGDVILTVEGTVIEKSSDLPRVIGELKPGQSVSLQVWRGGSKRDLKVSLGEVPSDKAAANDTEPAAKPGRLGLAVRPLSADEQRHLQVKGGLVVEQASGAAARAGIQAGDVILAAGTESINSVEQLRNIAGKAKDQIAVLVQRGDSKLYVPIKLQG